MQHCCIFHDVSASAASRITYQEYVLRIVRIDVLVLPGVRSDSKVTCQVLAGNAQAPGHTVWLNQANITVGGLRHCRHQQSAWVTVPHHW
jgi:hypothetical protein